MIIALDLETTWLDAAKDTIIEVALIKIDVETRKIIDTYNTFVNPQREIPEIISEITNIRQQDVEDAPLFSDIQQKVQDFIGDFPILWHNTNFDRSFLLSHGIEIQNNLVLDTFFLANFLLLDLKSLNLWFIANHLWISIESEHRAIDDTQATVKIYDALIQQLQKLDENQQKVYHAIVTNSNDKQGIFYYEKYLSTIQPYSEEKLIEYVLSSISIIDSSHKIEQNYDKNNQDIDTIFTNFDDFEVRENQKKMAHIVFESFTKSKKSVIEAPTGVGKTFAYLIPSILFSTQMGEQVFISTSTKTLQDQIYFKDLDFLSKNIGIDFSFCKLKGKKNYISLYAFFWFFDISQSIEKEKTSFILKILYWLWKTTSWELDELDFYGEEFWFLHEINANLPFTFHKENPYLEKEFIVQARNKAKKSNIVIVNNNILFQDIVSQGRILWKVKNLVLDESHSLEDVVTQSLKKSFSLQGSQKVFDSLIKTLKKEGISTSNFVHFQETISFEMASVLEPFMDYISQKVRPSSKYKNVLITSEFFTKFSHVNSLFEKLNSTISEFLDALETLPETLQLLIGRETAYFEEVQDILRHIFSLPEIFSTIVPVAIHNENYGIILEYTLLNPGDFLQKNLWDKLDSTILTSATLQIDNSYKYIEEMLSLQDFEFATLETDFDYAKQSLLFIPTDLWSIKHNTSEIIKFLQQILPLIWWRTLILVTAFAMIQQCFVSLNTTLKKEGIHLLAQSVSGGKQKQIEFFKSHADTSILIGTDTFWEGVDIKGDDLRYLIIHKIPFMVPSDPVFQARSSLFQDAFAQYAIPKSILKLKQWFGRLIRTKTDSGVVIFLDDRIFSSAWGERFLSAFPQDIKIRKSSVQNLISVIKK